MNAVDLKTKLIQFISEFDKDHADISNLVSLVDLSLNISFEEEVKNYIYKINSLKKNVIHYLYISILYYLLNDSIHVRYNFVIGNQLLIKLGLNKYQILFDEISKLLLVKNITNKNFNRIYTVKETSEILSHPDRKEDKKYVDRLLFSISQISNSYINTVEGTKNDIVDILNKEKPVFIVIVGHADEAMGYQVIEGSIEKWFNKIDLKNLLSVYDSKKKFTLLDFACSGNHFINYRTLPVESTIFSNDNSIHNAFNYACGYYYALGYFKKSYETQSLQQSHKMGLLTLSLWTYDYIDTYDYTEYKY